MAETVGPAELGRWLRAFADAVTDNADDLTALDSAIGDADHGVNMRRGMTAVIAKLDAAPATAPAALLKTAGMTLVSTVGGASGPLVRHALPADGDLGGRPRGARRRGVRRRPAGRPRGCRRSREGRSWATRRWWTRCTPAVDALDAALADGAGLGDALRAAANAADQGSDATIPLVARKGRASYLGERSAGHRDPGATSTALLVNTAAASLG